MASSLRSTDEETKVPSNISLSQEMIDTSVSPQAGSHQIQNNTIILKVNANSPVSGHPKLKSLLSRNLQIQNPKSGIQPVQHSFEMNEAETVSTEWPGTNVSFPHAESLSAQQKEVMNDHSELQAGATADALEKILHHLQNVTQQSSTEVTAGEVKSNLNAQTDGKFIYIPVETFSLPDSSGNNYSTQLSPSKEPSLHPNENAADAVSTNLLAASSSVAVKKEQHDSDPDVVKKTVVEAFVKMVVCRKVTVQKVNSKTGQVLDVSVKTEEEEPVILGVDCVETTEDLLSSSSTDSATGPNAASSTKWGSSLDGGLKFLSTVSESRQKIGKSLMKDSLLKVKASLQKGLSKVLQPASGTINPSSGNSRLKFGTISMKKEHEDDAQSNSDTNDWDEDLNDNSADYTPGSSKSNKQKSLTGMRSVKKSKLTVVNKAKASDLGLASKVKQESAIQKYDEAITEEPVVVLPKKRGRKRKWDNAIGLASNLRVCQFCSKHFSSVQSCAAHMKKGKCVSSTFCFICSKAFQDEKQLEKHLASHGNESKSNGFKCKDCHRSYRTRVGYVKHFREGTCVGSDIFVNGVTGDFPCDMCDSRFSTSEYLKLHRYKTHENPNDHHICPDCGKKFYSLQGFHKHRSARPCTEPLKCHICGKTYSNKAKESFKIHMKHHKTEVSGITFNCDECGRSYMTQTALTKHKLSHTGVKPYKCDTCGKEFAMRYMVKDHARMHTGERPYMCNLCGSAFSNKGHLGRHLRSHENGTLLRRGRPKKIRDSDENTGQETELKMIDLGQALQAYEGQAIQVVDGHMLDNPASGTPMIIQADNNTIIITEGWPNAASNSPVALATGNEISFANNIEPNAGT